MRYFFILKVCYANNMGVLHGRDLLSSKYVTAIIRDKTNRIHFVPIKNSIDDYFLVDINKQIYCFKIGQICQYREKLTKQFQVIFYDTTHYRPISPSVKELEMMLAANNLPKVNGMMSDVLKIFGKREKPKEKFKPHSLKDMIKTITDYEKSKISKIIQKDQNRFIKQAESIVNYLDNLDVDQISTPVRSISEFIEEDLKATDPHFLGTVSQTLQNLDNENKRVTNTPISGNTGVIKLLLVVMMVAAIGFMLYIAYDEGLFDGLSDITKPFGDISFQPINVPPPGSQASGNPCSDGNLQAKYPEPVQLKIAIANGSEPCKPSPFLQEILDGVDLPKVEAKN